MMSGKFFPILAMDGHLAPEGIPPAFGGLFHVIGMKQLTGMMPIQVMTTGEIPAMECEDFLEPPQDQEFDDDY
jgi:hypothetical protein